MKEFTILMMLLVFAAFSFGQQITPNQHWKESDFYKKSRKQKTAAWILTGAGVTGLILTLGVDMGQTTEEALTTIFTGVETEHKPLTVPYLLSTASVIGGTYLFFASSKNKKKAKAASLSIDMEKGPVLQGTVLKNQSFPALGIRIRLSS